MNYKVFVDGSSTKIEQASIFPMPYNEVQAMEYTQFQMNEPVEIRIESQIPITGVIIRPLSLKLKYTFNQKEIRIHLDEPKKFSVEINDSYYNNLAVFANPCNYEELDVDGENVVYFKKGIHTVDLLEINKDNTILYLEEGAFLHGKILVRDCSHITVCGYGTVCMENYPYESRDVFNRCLDVMFCKDVSVKDIMITDSNGWSLRVFGSEEVTIDNVKIIGCRGNSDGIDVCGSRNVLVKNIFTRVWDDSFVVKAFDTGNLENVTFKDSILWNDFARPLEVGVELRADKVKNVHFENIDIIHSPTGYPLMGIHHGDRAEVSDIYFENIRIENTPAAQLFDIRITDSVWNKDVKKGSIRNVTFKDIYYIGNPGMDHLLSPSRLQGFSKENRISHVTFENIRLLGKTVTSARECGLLCMDYVEEVDFKQTPHTDKIELIETGLEFLKEFSLNKNGSYSGTVRIRIKNTSEKTQNTDVWLQISPANVGEYNRQRFHTKLDGWEEKTVDYKVTLPPGKFVFGVQSDDINVYGDWKFLKLDWVIPGTEDLTEVKELEFINYYNIRTKGIKAAVSNGELLIQSGLLKDRDISLVIYAAMPAACQDGEVVFSVEETDFGEAPAVIRGKHGLELAPQLRCPAEITYVFKNEPKVKEIREVVIPGGGSGSVRIPLEELGLLKDTRNFWLEIEARTKTVEAYRYPYTLFHSVVPKVCAHMFADVVIAD